MYINCNIRTYMRNSRQHIIRVKRTSGQASFVYSTFLLNPNFLLIQLFLAYVSCTFQYGLQNYVLLKHQLLSWHSIKFGEKKIKLNQKLSIFSIIVLKIHVK